MKYLGIDFGLKRVGLAISEGELATPWKILEGIGLENFVMRISKIIQQVGFDKIVVGMPEGEMGQLTSQFVTKLRQRGFDVEEVDETLSTQRAIRIMVDLGLPKKKRAQPDAQAAAEILQTYLEDLRNEVRSEK